MEQTHLSPPTKRIILVAVTLLVLGVGAFFLFRNHVAGVGRALRAALGENSDVAMIPENDDVAASSTDPTIYSEIPAVSYRPPALKSGKTSGSAAASSAATMAASSAWCDWESSTSSAGGFVLSETNKSWIGLKNDSNHDVDTGGWEIISEKGSIAMKLAEKILQAGKSYHLQRSDVSDPDITAWLKLFDTNCELIAEVNAPSSFTAPSSLSSSRSVSSSAPPAVAAQNNSVTGTSADLPIQNNFSPADSENSSNSAEGDNNAQIISSTASTSAVTVTESSSSAPIVIIPDPTSTPADPIRLLIAAVQISGADGAGDCDVIKLYNPASTTVAISGWRLRKRTSTGAEESIRVFPKDTQIGAKAYFTWINAKYPAGADSTSTQTLAADNSVALFDPTGTLMDAVAWGKGKSQFGEGNPYPENPAAGKLLARKFVNSIILDTNDNASDFEVE